MKIALSYAACVGLLFLTIWMIYASVQTSAGIERAQHKTFMSYM